LGLRRYVVQKADACDAEPRTARPQLSSPLPLVSLIRVMSAGKLRKSDQRRTKRVRYEATARAIPPGRSVLPSSFRLSRATLDQLCVQCQERFLDLQRLATASAEEDMLCAHVDGRSDDLDDRRHPPYLARPQPACQDFIAMLQEASRRRN
jgi:hypothetical protein